MYDFHRNNVRNEINIIRLEVDRSNAEKSINEHANRTREIDSNIKLRELKNTEKQLEADVSVFSQSYFLFI